MNAVPGKKILHVNVPKSWAFKLKKKAIEMQEITGKYVSVAQLIMSALSEKYDLKTPQENFDKRLYGDKRHYKAIHG